MKWLDNIRNFFNPKPSPPVLLSRARLPGGRASQDSLDQFPTAAWIIAPPAGYESNYRLINIDTRNLDCYSPVELMEILADLSPEVSRALWDFLRMGNPGWEVESLRPGSDVQDERAQAATSAFIDLLADQHGTADIVWNRVLMGAFLRGALCGELVLDKRGRMPLDIATPDPASIRFRRRSDPERGQVWQAGQWQAHNFKPLDIPTFRYVPIDPMPNSPYGRPLASPALFTSLFLLGMLHDLKRVIQQQGYPRIDLSIDTERLAKAAPQIIANAETFQAFTQDLVNQVEAAYEALQPDDAYIHTDIVNVNKPVGTAGADSIGGLDAVIKMVERMAVKALKTMPLMMGITENVGDVQSNRQWEVYAAGIKSIQHYAETLISRLLALALEAQGIQATVVFRFAELRAAEALRDAQTEAMQIANEKAKYDNGWTSQDEASETITGHPADVPEPRATTGTESDTVQDNGDGQERVDQPPDRAQRVQTRVKIIPDGADEPLTPVPETVTITDTDIERALDEWDELMADYAGLLDATVVNDDLFEDADDNRSIQTRQRDPSPWIWDAATKRYRHESGRFIGARQMVTLRDQFIDAKKTTSDDLAQRLGRGQIDIQQWEIEFRRQVKTAFIDEYVLGRGGRNAMTQSDWGRIGRMVKDQYQFAHQFARDIADGKLSLTQIEARSRLYFDSATQAYERARSASYGDLVLPEFPADGSQICKCITTPESRVLTKEGWKPIVDVQIGDEVWTHRLRWRRVLATIVKPSEAYHQQVFIRAPDGQWVGATDNHKWYTSAEWHDSNGICNNSHLMVYYLLKKSNHSGDKHETLSEMQYGIRQPEQERYLSVMPARVRVWESKGSSGGILPVLRNESQGKRAVGESRVKGDYREWSSCGGKEPTIHLQRYNLGEQLGAQAGWTPLHLVLGRGSQANGVSVSMGMDQGKWPYPQRAFDSPQRFGQDQRYFEQSGVAATEQTRSIAWQNEAHRDDEKNTGAYLPNLPQDIQAPETDGSACDILFTGMLPRGTSLYDLTVEEDHSFVIEGLFAHNSNCKCHWTIEEAETEWRCVWMLNSAAEHCSSCQENAEKWNPLVILKGNARSLGEVKHRLEAMRNGHH